MAQSVFTYKVQELGLENLFVIDSFATSTEEIGNPPHSGTVRKLQQVGIPVVPHRAKQISWNDYDKFDYIIGMDEWNMKNLSRMLKEDPEGTRQQQPALSLISFSVLSAETLSELSSPLCPIIESSPRITKYSLE